ncbi:hypothetical protein BKA70DRAFT_175525 [Coprinopsis sp. MPI-PUGE-AT-0042]|nr:hypothetical protein BKA70DRAFT_175525 [Coprinopsis sp. MPI-PUGE-AT-0042]
MWGFGMSGSGPLTLILSKLAQGHRPPPSVSTASTSDTATNTNFKAAKRSSLEVLVKQTLSATRAAFRSSTRCIQLEGTTARRRNRLRKSCWGCC